MHNDRANNDNVIHKVSFILKFYIVQSYFILYCPSNLSLTIAIYLHCPSAFVLRNAWIKDYDAKFYCIGLTTGSWVRFTTKESTAQQASSNIAQYPTQRNLEATKYLWRQK